MKPKRFIFFIIILVFLSSSLTLSANPEFDKNTRTRLIDHIEGQLVVCIEDRNVFSAQSTNNSIPDAISIMKLNGFNVVDSLDNDIYTHHHTQNYTFSIQNYDSHFNYDNLLNYDKSFKIQSYDGHFKEKILQNIGNVMLVEYPDKYQSIETAIKNLEKILTENHYNVKYIEPNYILKALAEDTTSMHSYQKWYLNMINIPDAWNISTGHEDVKIAVLDSGIDYNHESLKNLVNTDLAKTYIGNGIMDEGAHGTHVASVIASYGKISGVMKKATIIPIKVLNKDGLGSSYDIQKAILYASGINADVINMSFGGEFFSRGLNAACEFAFSNGSILVSATGNDNKGEVMYPAAYDTVIAVGAVDMNMNKADFSSYGDKIDIVAPGTFIYGAIPGNKYAHFSGTSSSAPQVSAVAGLIRSLDKDISPEDVRRILTETARDLGNKNYFGHGLLDAHAALLAVKNTDDTNPHSYTLGDVNRDGSINSADLTLISRYILEVIDDFPSIEGKNAADINNDGEINSFDYTLLQMHILEIIDIYSLKK
ncbi:S8 family serine peptidase [Acetivibrio saccincola]|uniref:Dockerin domain-containing protein n=1 Tax=Acetivibrio saccincola TaxID=1677857 RepID=A0A2S8RC76_9FIRM|nr:S8 family serine peptidase [Acetivibrio saccincola]PQQ67402.1 hypothetical protein B9R14_12025 [Acetivibrio saccincola]